ncbi:MAG: substrate-binding domain-containing protein [Gemmataceae bacterium]
MARAWPLFLLLLAGCRPADKPPRHVVLSGSRTLMPLLRAVGERFTAGCPDVRIDFEPGLSSRGALDTRQGLADVGMLTRGLKVEETGLVAHPLGRDALAFAVHRDNPVASLSDSQLTGLFARSYASWKELGGTDRPVVLVGLTDGRAGRAQLLERLALEPGRAKPDVAVPTSEQVAQAVAARPGAIGCVSVAAAREAVASRAVRLLPLAGVLPDADTICTSKYPFVRPAVLVTRPNPPDCVGRFVAFACSPDQHDLLLAHGFAPP